MKRRTLLGGLLPAILQSETGTEKLADGVTVAGREISLAKPPRGLVLREPLGLLCHESIDGQLVHRTSKENLWEVRATVTPKGDFLMMFPEGAHYSKASGKVNEMIAYRSADRGKTWRGPEIAFEIDYSQHGFIPLVPRGSKRLYAFGTQPVASRYSRENGKHENAPIGYRWSDDDGRSWSTVRLIEPANDPGYLGMSVMRMCETGRGTWILGTHEADWSVKPLRTRIYLLRSEDRGKTWTLAPGKRPGGWTTKGFNRMDEVRPICLGGAKLLAMIRTPEGHLWSMRSEDDGRTWSDPAPTSLIHPDAPPMIFTLSDGKTLAAFHHNRYSLKNYEGLNRSPQVMMDRSEMWVSFSKDEGRAWSAPRFLFVNALAATLPDAFFNYQCSYLDAFTDSGTLHMFVPHRWQRVLHLRMREGDLMNLPEASKIGGS